MTVEYFMFGRILLLLLLHCYINTWRVLFQCIHWRAKLRYNSSYQVIYNLYRLTPRSVTPWWVHKTICMSGTCRGRLWDVNSLRWCPRISTAPSASRVRCQPENSWPACRRPSWSWKISEHGGPAVKQTICVITHFSQALLNDWNF